MSRDKHYRINVSKSTLFVASREKQALESEAVELGLSVSMLPMRYLGLPLTTKKMTKVDYEPLVDKIRTRLMSWTCRHLSYAGRLQLINSVIMSISNFWCSAFRLPKTCFEEIESMCKKFIWSGSPNGQNIANIAWKEICIPKGEGDLEIRRLKEVSRVFGLHLI